VLLVSKESTPPPEKQNHVKVMGNFNALKGVRKLPTPQVNNGAQSKERELRELSQAPEHQNYF
jgi:hypothetical protein